MSEIRAYYQESELSDETRRRLPDSKQEAAALTLRDIYCPYCGYLVERMFSDITGHKMVFCKKCKEEYPVNLGYFRRMKRQHVSAACRRRDRQHR